MSDVILKVESVSKQYRLGLVSSGTLSHDLKRWWYKIRRKEDPFLQVGEANDRSTVGNSDYVWALRDINFELKRGEVLGIIGKNGAGKSTLLKILSRVTSPSTGVIKTKGRIASLLEVGTGFHPEMTGLENIYLNGAILGMTKKEIKFKEDEIIDFSGCRRYINTPVKRYSSGMRVRLAFAVAAHLEPDILVVDEVLAVGDAEFQKKAIGKMQDISREDGRTVLFVSHNMGAIMNLCTRALVLEHGNIVFEGDEKEAVNFYIMAKKDKEQIDLKHRNDRIGNGQFLISYITLMDSNHNPISEVLSGKDLIIRVEIDKKEDIDYSKLIVSIAFQDSNENTVLLFSSDELKSDFTNLNNSNSFFLKIPKLPLRGSFYSLRLVTTYKTTRVEDFIDTIDNAFKVSVIENDFLNTGKKLRRLNQVFLEGEFMA
ncbi:ABC transporter ATP-binding protein [Flavivirga aquimarina]|uniref:ABC transporter ATP-binding protein n=1 Tax=Flavivirga aquimarina TaxID=2027862 RepID=A0ABT8WBZ0_9FLAO|nr:ABC transporter ATP-binding protein [Flavivirga aquimarina]MDO5970568.1 ABC transporter ATP-binding protein [Flavivirga aquimarina]